MLTSVRIENRTTAVSSNSISRELEIKKAVQRHKRAQSLAAMGLVSREGDRFRVTTPAQRGKQVTFEVWRNEAGRVCCTCPEFDEQSAMDATFRCEHILAVKHTLSNSTQAGAQEASVSVMLPRATPPSKIAEAPAKLEALPKIIRRKEEDNMQSDEFITAAHEMIPVQEEFSEEFETAAPDAPVVKPEVKAESKADAPLSPRGNVVPLAFTNLLRTLRQPIDPKLVRTREGWTDRQGNTHLVEYVEWHTVADILDRVAPNWSHSVRHIAQIGEMVAVTAAITIDGVTREGVGTGSAENETGIKKAEHDALKRAAIKFGIARDLYQRESDIIEKQGAHTPGASFPRDPLAKSLADLVTPKQLGMIRVLGRELGLDVEKECVALMNCSTEELSKQAASRMIDYLKRKQQETQPEEDAGDLLRAS